MSKMGLTKTGNFDKIQLNGDGFQKIVKRSPERDT